MSLNSGVCVVCVHVKGLQKDGLFQYVKSLILGWLNMGPGGAISVYLDIRLL